MPDCFQILGGDVEKLSIHKNYATSGFKHFFAVVVYDCFYTRKLQHVLLKNERISVPMVGRWLKF